MAEKDFPPLTVSGAVTPQVVESEEAPAVFEEIIELERRRIESINRRTAVSENNVEAEEASDVSENNVEAKEASDRRQFDFGKPPKMK